MLKRCKSFAKANSGVAAIEFSLVLAPLILLSLGAFEVQRYLRFERQLALAAETIAAMAAQRLDGNGEAPRQDYDAIQHIGPAMPDWFLGIAFQITNVAFTPTEPTCNEDCDYTADVTWTWPVWTAMGSLRRSCGKLNKSEGTSSPSGKTLPANVFGPGNVIVVDLITTYQPVLGSAFISPIKLTRQGFANARFASPYMKINPFNNLVKCDGYP